MELSASHALASLPRNGFGAALREFSSIGISYTVADGLRAVLERGCSAAVVPLPDPFPLGILATRQLRKSLAVHPHREIRYTGTIQEALAQLEEREELPIQKASALERETMNTLFRWLGREEAPLGVVLDSLFLHQGPRFMNPWTRAFPHCIHVSIYPAPEEHCRLLQIIGSLNRCPGTLLIPSELMTLGEFLQLRDREGQVGAHQATLHRLKRAGIRPSELMTPPGFAAIFPDGRNGGTPHAAPTAIGGRVRFETIAFVDWR